MVSKYGLRAVALGYLGLLLAAPVEMICYRAFEHGIGPAWDAVTTPEAQHAFWLTFEMVGSAVPANTILGISMALLLVLRNMRARCVLDVIIDPPCSSTPVVVGL